MGSFRRLKSDLREILGDDRWRERFGETDGLEPRKLLGPLFAMLLDRNENVRWRAVEALGRLVGRMAGDRLEPARETMRMFMWRLNEESGNLGWGVPESMAASMAANTSLAKEFVSILVSYVQSEEGLDGNYLDHPELRRGVYWGLGRLAQDQAGRVREHASALRRGLKEQDPACRGFAAWALGVLGDAAALDDLDNLASDQAAVRIFRDGEVRDATVAALASEAAQAIRTMEADHA
jgi:HEAT repeat protein